jgi:hypothetical protein
MRVAKKFSPFDDVSCRERGELLGILFFVVFAGYASNLRGLSASAGGQVNGLMIGHAAFLGH